MNGSHISRNEFRQRSAQLFGPINSNRRWIEHHAMARQFGESVPRARKRYVDELGKSVALSLS
jgi:hypothetical protein